MIYVYYSAPFDLSESFATPEYFKAIGKDTDCFKILENTVTGELRVLAADPYTLKAENDHKHYSLMICLSENLPSESTLLMPDITSLSDMADEADCLYQRFIDKNINLEFSNSPWLNTKNMRILLISNPYEAKKAISSSLISTFEWKSQPQVLSNLLPSPSVTQQTNAVKKNSF